MGYYPKIEWDDNATTTEKLRAIYNLLNWLLFEMSQGRVKTNKEELIENIKNTKEELNLPISIAFVKLAESGNIDEATASENANLFLPWATNTNYKIGDLRTYPQEKEIQTAEGETVTVAEKVLYKCLQTHTSQDNWTPDVSSSLWKSLSVNENGISEWSQPISSVDAYNTGDEVMYNGVHYRSIIDNNVWAPDAYPQGWEVVADDN
jgi:hypothetical protein